MRIALSNIAWDRAEDADVAALLRRHGVHAVDLVASKYFADAAAATDAQVRAIRAWWADHGLEVTGMQALLFGTTGLALFGEASARDAMLRHLAHVCRIGGGLGARALVFGSPRNRDRGALGDAEVEAIADPFFRALGDIAADHGVVVCLEPNPPHYGGTFMTTSAETRTVVARIDHPAIRMQFDTGALTISGEAPGTVLAEAAPWIAHVHASEPDLLPIGDGRADHAAMAAALARHRPDRVVAIEMLATKDEPHLAAIERAVVATKRFYGDTAR
jgi:sugar phosphate isomerase/epimerase